jgi:glycosyltransferase involved in cell wall biosynthesis
MKINYIIPNMTPGQPKSAGTMVVYEYIKGLAERGHDVTVVALEYFGHSPSDANFKGRVIVPPKKYLTKKRFERIPRAIIRRIAPSLPQRLEKRKSATQRETSFVRDRFESLRRAIPLVPDCDANIATSYQTALAVYFSGKGVPFYFMQSFEEYFAGDCVAPDFAFKDSSLSYILPLRKIANSTWLKQEVEKRHPQDRVMAVIPNGIHTDFFYPRNVKKDPANVKIISYGGREFVRKGFLDAAKAMQIVRKKYPAIEWDVFGDALLPPDNDLARYHPVGFVAQDKLAVIYSACDILLYTSWFDSFPMVPIEAMACGLGVVTTPLGAEDYARDGDNCLIVPPKSPEASAKAVIELIENKPLRDRLGKNGIETAKKFTWKRAVDEMEDIILRGADISTRS